MYNTAKLSQEDFFLNLKHQYQVRKWNPSSDMVVASAFVDSSVSSDEVREPVDFLCT